MILTLASFRPVIAGNVEVRARQSYSVVNIPIDIMKACNTVLYRAAPQLVLKLELYKKRM